jgi:DNA polymerase III subunit chi
LTRVQFFHNADDRLTVAAAWLRESWRQRRQVVVFAPVAAIAGRIDQLLWTQPATGFVPHCNAGSPLAGETPIVLAANLEQLPHDQVLLNLGDETPPGFSRFETLVEIVSSDEEDRQAARARFRYYRERGYAIETTDLTAEPQPW